MSAGVAAVTGLEPVPRPTAGFGNLLLAEWTKFRSVRSSSWTLLIAAAVTVGLGAALLPSVVDGYDGPTGQAAAVAVEEGWWFLGLHIAILAVMIQGVLVIGSEYGTGTIRATLAAVPSRPRVMAAKVVSFAAVTFVTGAAQATVAFLVAVPILADHSINVALTDPVAWRGIVAATLAMVGAGLLGLGTGVLLRHTAGAIGAVVAVMWVLPELTLFLPPSWGGVGRVQPANAMYAMFTPVEMQLLPVGPATALFLGYVAGILAIAGVLFARRDA